MWNESCLIISWKWKYVESCWKLTNEEKKKKAESGRREKRNIFWAYEVETAWNAENILWAAAEEEAAISEENNVPVNRRLAAYPEETVKAMEEYCENKEEEEKKYSRNLSCRNHRWPAKTWRPLWRPQCGSWRKRIKKILCKTKKTPTLLESSPVKA